MLGAEAEVFALLKEIRVCVGQRMFLHLNTERRALSTAEAACLVKN